MLLDAEKLPFILCSWVQVAFAAPVTVLPDVAHPGDPEQGMPPLCFVEMTIDVQVGSGVCGACIWACRCMTGKGFKDR